MSSAADALLLSSQLNLSLKHRLRLAKLFSKYHSSPMFISCLPHQNESANSCDLLQCMVTMFANKRLCDFLGYESDTIVGRNCWFMRSEAAFAYHKQDRLGAVLGLQSEDLLPVSLEVFRRDGLIQECDLLVSTLHSTFTKSKSFAVPSASSSTPTSHLSPISLSPWNRTTSYEDRAPSQVLPTPPTGPIPMATGTLFIFIFSSIRTPSTPNYSITRTSTTMSSSSLSLTTFLKRRVAPYSPNTLSVSETSLSSNTVPEWAAESAMFDDDDDSGAMELGHDVNTLFQDSPQNPIPLCLVPQKSNSRMTVFEALNERQHSESASVPISNPHASTQTLDCEMMDTESMVPLSLPNSKTSEEGNKARRLSLTGSAKRFQVPSQEPSESNNMHEPTLNPLFRL